MFDDKVAEMCGWIDDLKDKPDSYESICVEMTEKMYWRLMEEFPDNCTNMDNMCSLWDVVEKTGINDTAFQAEKNRGTRPQSTNSFCAGDETEYHYSLYECSMFPGKCVSVVLDQRRGKQLILVIPYNPSCISTRVFVNEKEIEMSDNPVREGSMEFYIEVGESDHIRIDVYNESSFNQSFVLINHNSCR